MSHEVESHEVQGSDEVYRGAIITVRVDTVSMSEGPPVKREVVEHDDSVAVVAYDIDDRVLLMRQYRHPLRTVLLEVPAGLCDVEGEEPLETARRELREEAGLTAERWTPLVTVHSSPGILTEKATIYLAEQLTVVDRAPDGAEEQDIELEWVQLPAAVQRVRDGEITDNLAVSGLYAAADHLTRRVPAR